MIRLAYRLFLFFVVSLTMVSCSENYSRGEKVGTVIEFAQSGLIWDSWDGRLNLTQTGMNTAGEPFTLRRGLAKSLSNTVTSSTK